MNTPVADHEVSASRIAVYTAAFHGYDIVFPPRHRSANVDYIAFADQGTKLPAEWSRRLVALGQDDNGSEANRRIKILCQEYLPEYDYSVYVDGNIRIRGDISELLSRFISSGAAIGLAKHGQRSSIAEEAYACVELGKIPPEQIDIMAQQVESYQTDGLPDSHVLTDNGVIFRWHRHPQLPGLMETWWRELNAHVRRDQICLPYVLWKSGLQPLYWDWKVRLPNPYFSVHPHRGTWLKNIETVLGVWCEDSAMWTLPRKVVSRLRRDLENVRPGWRQRC